jgi:ATP-grasp ribosomal peptide maturase
VSSTVLVVTARFDLTADRAVTALNERAVSLLRFDLADFPETVTVRGKFEGERWDGELVAGARRVGLEEISGVYYRRPTNFVFPASMTDREREWANSEARMGFGGLLGALPGWLNHPQRIAAAEYKPTQLAIAARCALRTPVTLVTNDPDAAVAFADRFGEVVCKPFGPNGIDEEGVYKIVYAERLTAAQLDTDAARAGVAVTAHQFQQPVEAAYAVRLTVVDTAMFAAAIHAHSDAARRDWRRDYAALDYETTTVPDAVRVGVLRLMSALGLRFGALDFLVTDCGEWVFLEINPNGQWAWIDQVANPIAHAVADALTKGM